MRAEKITPTAAGGTAVSWYERTELFGPWRIAACADHGVELRRHRFRPVGATVDGPSGIVRSAERCGVCADPQLLIEVERCTCEDDTARCPVHQNVGCGG